LNFYLSPGLYKFEAYGASGAFSTIPRLNNTHCKSQIPVYQYRGNTVCLPVSSSGAGGYASGIIYLKSITQIFINIGGTGSYFLSNSSYNNIAASETMSERSKGGYNGGGYGTAYSGGCSGGGG
jgi:hypothetical protein